MFKLTGNQIIHRVSAITEEFVSHGRVKIKNPEADLAIRCASGFLFGFIISTAKIFGGRSPFGLGYAATRSFSLPDIFSIAGVTAGYLVSGSFSWAIKYIAALILIIAASLTFRKSEFILKEWFMPLNAGFMTFCIGFIYLADAGVTPINILLFMVEAILAAAGAWAYDAMFNEHNKRRSYDSYDDIRSITAVLFTLSSILIAVSSIEFFDFISLGRILASTVILLITFNGKSTYGCPAAIIIGVALDSAADISPYFTVIYGFAALVSGTFARHGKYIFALSFVFVSSAAAVWSYTGMMAVAALCEVLFGAVIFIVLPKKLIFSVGALLPSYQYGNGAVRARDYTRKRIEQTASAFRELYESVREADNENGEDINIASVFDNAADKICRKCPFVVKCWQLDYQNTLNVLNDITETMMQKGSVSPQDFPVHFADSCKHIDEFSDAISQEIRRSLYHHSYKNRLLEKQGAAYNQYADIAAVLNGLAADLAVRNEFETEAEHRLLKYLKSLDISASVAVFRDRGGRLHAELSGPRLYKLSRTPGYLDRLSSILETRLCTSELRNSAEHIELLEAEPFTASVGIAAAKKSGQTVNGDRGTYFKTDEGMLYIILSDGMGTGTEAAKCSGSAVHILERFLRSGVSPEAAIRILNGLMLLKNANDTICVTVDLMCISLFTGETKIFKYGAAPSYVRKSNGVSRIDCHSFAAGLGTCPDDRPDVIRLKLLPSSIAVIASDGVMENGDDKWLRTYIEEYEGTSPKELARNIIRSSIDKFGSVDDMTVITVFMEERK